MEYTIRPVERALEYVGLQDVAADIVDLHARVGERIGEVRLPPAYEIVVNDNLADIGSRELIDRMRADQAGPADDDDFLVREVHSVHLREGLAGMPWRVAGQAV